MSYLDQITIGSTTYDIQDSAIPSWARASSAPVESVNNQTGVITLTASDVGALPTTTIIPSAATNTPLIDSSIGALGSSSAYALEDHQHPVDTSRQATITASGILKGSGSDVSAAALGTDYTKVNIGSVTISSANWSGSGPYTQTITISGATITAKTKVDIQPNATAYAQLVSDKVSALFISNDNGTLTVYAVGAATTANITVQVSYYETV